MSFLDEVMDRRSKVINDFDKIHANERNKNKLGETTAKPKEAQKNKLSATNTNEAQGGVGLFSKANNIVTSNIAGIKSVLGSFFDKQASSGKKIESFASTVAQSAMAKTDFYKNVDTKLNIMVGLLTKILDKTGNSGSSSGSLLGGGFGGGLLSQAYDAAKPVIKGAGKIIGKIAAPLAVASGAYEGFNALSNLTKQGDEDFLHDKKGSILNSRAGNYAKSAASGAAIGAGVGSFLGPGGTLAGGAIGGAVGFSAAALTDLGNKVVKSIAKGFDDANIGSIISSAFSNVSSLISGIASTLFSALNNAVSSAFSSNNNNNNSSGGSGSGGSMGNTFGRANSNAGSDTISAGRNDDSSGNQNNTSNNSGDGNKPGFFRRLGNKLGITADSGIGSISAKYESGGRGVTTISSGVVDAGGVSYGTHQLSSKTGTAQDFINSPENKQFADQFSGLKPGTSEFNAAYSKVAGGTDSKAFAEAQQNYITRTHYAPVEAKAKSLGIDTENPAIQQALFSQSVQHGYEGNKKILENVVKSGVDLKDSDAVIKQIYKSRGEYASKFANSSATTDRYNRESKDVLALNAQAKKTADTDPANTDKPSNDNIAVTQAQTKNKTDPHQDNIDTKIAANAKMDAEPDYNSSLGQKLTENTRVSYNEQNTNKSEAKANTLSNDLSQTNADSTIRNALATNPSDTMQGIYLRDPSARTSLSLPPEPNNIDVAANTNSNNISNNSSPSRNSPQIGGSENNISNITPSTPSTSSQQLDIDSIPLMVHDNGLIIVNGGISS